MVLIAKKLDEIVEGTVVTPDKEKEKEFYSKWRIDDPRARYILTTGLLPEIYSALTMCDTAAEMWKQLESEHEEKFETNKMAMMQRFHRLHHLESGESISVYIA